MKKNPWFYFSVSQRIFKNAPQRNFFYWYTNFQNVGFIEFSLRRRENWCKYHTGGLRNEMSSPLYVWTIWRQFARKWGTFASFELDSRLSEYKPIYVCIKFFVSMRQEWICNQFLDRLNKKNFTPEKLWNSVPRNYR